MAQELSLAERDLNDLKQKQEEAEAQAARRSREKKEGRENQIVKPLMFSGKVSEKARRPAKVSFEEDDKGLHVTIETEKLHLHSVTEKEGDAYAELYGDKEVMEKFATGVPVEKKKVQERVAMWVDRWKKGIPFSSFSVFEQDSDQDARDLCGQVVLGFGDKPKESELAYLFHRKHWRKGIGSEAVAGVVLDYAPELPKRGKKIKGENFEAIVATARIDNPGSWKILDKLGMEREKDEQGKDLISEKFGGKRFHYRKKIG